MVTARSNPVVRFAALAAWIILGLVALAGCAERSSVGGEIDGRAFQVDDAVPEVRHGGGETRIVIAEPAAAENDDPEAPDDLWLVTLTLPDAFKIELEKETPIGPADSDLPSLEIAVGELEVEEVDGAQVASTKATKFVQAKSGSLAFYDLDKVFVVEFTAILDGGGSAAGHFEVDAQALIKNR